MLLSVIIVNYNVKYFLEQCLHSVKKALDFGAAFHKEAVPFAEVLVVDNHSTDGSIEYLRPLFPFAKFISNHKNLGFSKANNQALQLAQGKYVLFLNPDTILPEDVFQRTIAFMEAHPNAGALGVHMVDGAGIFLKESKRGLPTPWVSFCKMSGLTALFPSSHVFSKYYMGHLNESSTHEVDVIAGAFMLASKQALNKTGGFDEQFFMYAEDIDLSYRMQKAGYVNYYYADVSIIHFKGESTRKDARYVKLFYRAMQQFVRKHYRSGSGILYAGLMNTAISLRSFLSLLRPVVRKPSIAILEDVTLKGDEDTIKRLRPALAERGIKIIPTSNNIIFCGSSFESIISSILQLNSGQHALIHARGSKSIVGSWDKNEQGNAFEVF